MTSRAALAILVLLAGPSACGRRSPATAAARLQAMPAPPRMPPRAFALPPAEMARLLGAAPFEFRAMERAHGGVMGVARATAYFPDAKQELRIKWAPAPRRTVDGWNNCPRKELGAFAIQQWFLDADDWLVPPSALRCVPVAGYHGLHGAGEPTVDGTQCVLGLIAAWIEHVRVPDVVYDPERFASDRRYAQYLADFNLFTYLIDHQDGRDGNFLVSDDPADPRIYAIDNGIAFGNLVWNYFVTNWNVLRVPALRRASIERLRHVTQADLGKLLVLVELHADGEGMLHPVPAGTPLDLTHGARIRDGRVQLGLTAAEARAVGTRLQTVIAQVDAGEIPVF